MNDFHIALLWLRALEFIVGNTSALMMSELWTDTQMHDLFARYRSPYKA